MILNQGLTSFKAEILLITKIEFPLLNPCDTSCVVRCSFNGFQTSKLRDKTDAAGSAETNQHQFSRQFKCVVLSSVFFQQLGWSNHPNRLVFHRHQNTLPPQSACFMPSYTSRPWTVVVERLRSEVNKGSTEEPGRSHYDTLSWLQLQRTLLLPIIPSFHFKVHTDPEWICWEEIISADTSPSLRAPPEERLSNWRVPIMIHALP